MSLIDTDVHAWSRLLSCYRFLGDADGQRVAAKATVAQAEKILAQDPSNGAALSFGAGGLAALGQALLQRRAEMKACAKGLHTVQ